MFNPKKKRCLDGETWRRSPPSISATVSKVLDTDDLLIEILLRVGFPTTLVRTSAVCRRWLHHVSDRKFLRRFRGLHPPCLIGFYAADDSWSVRTLRFVPMPPPQPPELAAVVRLASSSMDSYQSTQSVPTYMLGCRNGGVLLSQHDGSSGTGATLGVHSLLHPERVMAAFPPCPLPRIHDGGSYIYWEILSKEEEGRLSYFYVLMHSDIERKYTMRAYRLQDGAWCMHNLAIEQIPHPPALRRLVLVGDKIYMAAAWSDIIVLDLTISSFSMIRLPQGVEHGGRSTMLSRGDDAADVYLIHVKELCLRVWIHKGDGRVLVHTIGLREMFASLSMLDCNALPRLNWVGDYADFVFFEMDRCVLHLDIRCRTIHKVYETTIEDRRLGDIYPCLTIWPPTFPTLKDNHARDAM